MIYYRVDVLLSFYLDVVFDTYQNLFNFGISATTIFDRYTKVTKHIEMKYLLVKEVQKRVLIDHISTSDNISDPLTKRQSSNTFMEHVKNMVLD